MKDLKSGEEILAFGRHCMDVEAAGLREASARLGEDFISATREMYACKGKVIVTGMGKSGLVGRKIAATLSSTGTPSFFLHPAEAFHGDLGVISKNDVVLALSYSGETDEVLKILPFIQENGNPIIAIVGNTASSLGRCAKYAIDVSVAEEACYLQLAPSSSTTVQMAVGDALAITLMRMRGFEGRDFARFHPGGSLGRRLLLRVENVMRSDNLPVVRPDCPMPEMITVMSHGRLGLVILCRDGAICGIVTDGDLRRAMESRASEFMTLHAEDIATPDPKTISMHEKLIDAERSMTERKITSLLVTDDNKRLVGGVQIYDIKL